MKGLTNAQSGGGGSALDYSIIFQVEGADYFVMSCLDGDSIAAPPVPVVSGKAFLGWYIGAEKVAFPYTPTANVTMVANMLSVNCGGFTGMTNSDSTLTWTDDIAHLQDSPAYTLETSGSYVTVKSVLEGIWPFSDITEMTDAQGNVAYAWRGEYPRIWGGLRTIRRTTFI